MSSGVCGATSMNYCMARLVCGGAGKKPSDVDEDKAIHLREVCQIEIGHFSKAFERVAQEKRHKPWLCFSMVCSPPKLACAYSL